MGKVRILEQYYLKNITFNTIIEYYLLKDTSDYIDNDIKYGVRLAKWSDYFYYETKAIPFITRDKLLITDIIEKLIFGKVTPICLEDVVSDYLN